MLLLLKCYDKNWLSCQGVPFIGASTWSKPQKKSLLLTRNTSNIFLETVCLIWMKTLQIFCFNFWSIFYFVTKFYFQPLKTNLSLIIFLLTKRLWCWYLDIHKFSFDPAKKCSVLCNGELCTWFDKLEFSFFSWYSGCRLF